MSTRTNTEIHPQRRRLAGLALAALVTLAPAADALAETPSKRIGPAEEQRSEAIPIEQVVQQAEPFAIPRAADMPWASAASERPRGPRIVVHGVAARSAGSGAIKRKRARRTRKKRPVVRQNGPWSGAFNANPNRQVGKLYFDTKPGPGVSRSHCTATAINSENRSVVMTAGHCVSDPKTRTWFEDVRFCPGYENGCNLGEWKARHLYTTNGWFNAGDWTDDAAIVLVSPNPSGYLVDAVGGQGITFNENTGLDRHAFGYPVSDRRWPAYKYSGEDLIYCGGRDRYQSGSVILGCTMTGGASGGPWISGFGSTGLGYVNGVNSNKPLGPGGGKVMASPYFGGAENTLFQTARAR